jgi:tellurite resistance protein TerC
MIIRTKNERQQYPGLNATWSRLLPLTLCHGRKVVVALLGGTVLAIGVALIVLPGPAIVVIPIGLAILATEFVWARRWLAKAREFIKRTARK